MRIKIIFSKSIYKEQFGFLAGRHIHEAIGVAQECLHNLKVRHSRGVVLEIDLSKAYDRVEWTYIRLLLTHLGFEVLVINWMMACITSISFAILINGVASPFFKLDMGLRQGIPLSPPTLPFGSWSLSRALDHEIRHCNFRGILVARDLRITHLFFVDDVLILCDGSKSDADKLQ
jgi:hypothetical protein